MIFKKWICFLICWHCVFNVFAQKKSKDLCKQIHPFNNSSNYEDLNFLKEELQDKKMVLLGEAMHGVKQFANSKIRLVKFLHEELGYNVLAIEDEMCLASINYNASDSSLLQQSLFHSAWKSNEMLDLMHYLKTHPKLKLVGFDMPNYTNKSCKYLDELVKGTDSSLLKSLKTAEMSGMDYISHCFKSSKKANLIKEQQDALAAYNLLREDVLNVKPTKINADSLKILLQLINNRIYYVSSTLPGDNLHTKYYEFRDSYMAQNLTWIAESLFPNEKLIVFSHNMHIAKARPKHIAYLDNHNTMGSLLPQRIKDSSYTISLLAYQGKFRSYVDKNTYELGKRKKGSAEYNFNKCNCEEGFLALHNIQIKLNRFYSTRYLYKMDLRKMYDAVLFIKNVEPQKF